MSEPFYAGLLGRDMAVDLGTANTLVYVRGRGVVLDEPSVVAVNVRDGRPLAVGIEAKKMIGRTPEHILAIRPLKDGVIADFDICEKMLRYFIQRVHPRKWARPRMVICVPSGITGVEQRAVQEAAEQAGARKPAYIIEEPMAAAIGAGLPVHEPAGNMIVDIGGGTTEVAVISLGGIVASESIRIAGDELDDAIITYVKKEYALALGERTAEEIKIALGSAYPLQEELYAEVRGRDLVTGLPKTIVVSTAGDPRGDRGAGRRDRRHGEGHARQDAARARGRHHDARHRRDRRRRDAARPERAPERRDRHADRHRDEPALLGRAGFRAVSRELRRAQGRPELDPAVAERGRGRWRGLGARIGAGSCSRWWCSPRLTLITLDSRSGRSGPLGAVGRVAHTIVSPDRSARPSAVARPDRRLVERRGRLRQAEAREPLAPRAGRRSSRASRTRRAIALQQNNELKASLGLAQTARRHARPVAARVVDRDPGNFESTHHDRPRAGGRDREGHGGRGARRAWSVT